MRDAAELDRRLAADAGEGDERAFAELVGRHRGSLVRFVARRTGRGALAEDAVQEALVSAHRALRAGKRPTDVRAWLHTIAWRRALDLARTERDTVPLEAAEVATAATAPDEAAVLAAELERILRHWSALPHRQRRALALSVLEGRSLHDIGAALDISEHAAKALVARSRRTLADRVSAEERRCESVGAEILRSVERGTRLTSAATHHVAGCTTCARLHRTARMRRRLRAAALFPVALVARVRDLGAVLAGAEPTAAFVAKGCAVACVASAGGSLMVTGGTANAPALDHRIRPVTQADLELVRSHVVVRNGVGAIVAEHRCRWREPGREDRPCLTFAGDPSRGAAAIRAADGATATAHVTSEGYDVIRRLSQRADGTWLMRVRGTVKGKRTDGGLVCNRKALRCQPWEAKGGVRAPEAIRRAARRIES